MRHTREKIVFRVILVTLILASCTFEEESKCPRNFIPVNKFCVVEFNDFTREGSFEKAWEFCNSFNPKGFKGSMWTIRELDQLTTDVLISLVKPGSTNVDEESESKSVLPIWNGFNSAASTEDEEQDEWCSVIEEKNGQLEISERNCNDSMRFICAIKRHPSKCTDFINSDFCASHKNYFCDTTGQLATLCPQTCGLCERIHSCDGKVDFWGADFCHDMAGTGACSSVVDNIAPFCPLTCCRHTHEAISGVGDKALSEALDNDCKGTHDLAKCPNIPNTEKCFEDSSFTFACMRTCCLFSQSIREVALDAKPMKRFQDFEQDIAEHHCRRQFDDQIPSLCAGEGLDCDSKKYAFYCEFTCCLEEFRQSRGPTTVITTAEITTTEEPEDACELYTNIYSTKVCKTVTDVEDCADSQFRKHCKKRCCELGYDYAEGTTTVSPDEPCDEFTDEKPRCARHDNDVDACESGDCPFTCCMFQLGSSSSTLSTQSSTASSDSTVETTTLIDPVPIVSTPEESDASCNDFEDLMSKCATATEEKCRTVKIYEEKCPYSCCKVLEDTPGYVIGGNGGGVKPKLDCDEYEDEASKCPKLATERKCYDEPYVSLCKATCCNIGVIAFTQDPPTPPTNVSTEDPCSFWIDTLNKCNGITEKKTCLDRPFDTRCRETCCRLGVDFEDYTSTTTEIPGDICVGKVDRATKCLLLKEKDNAEQLCKEDKWYKTYCEASCCLILYDPGTTAEPEESTTKLVCNDLEDVATNCDELELTESLCKEHSYKKMCGFTCCLIRGGELYNTTTVNSTIEESTPVPTTAPPPFGNGIFTDCTEADIESPEFCSAVVASHVYDTGDLCQDITVRPKCLFSCCAYYYATDEHTPECPDPLEPENCRNLVDVYPYEECFENYLEDECDINCQLTCCLLEEANVPVNPGCYDRDDNGRQGYCLTNCQSEDDCQTEKCKNKCSFTCCVIHTDPGTAETPKPTGPSGASTAKPTTTVTIPYHCDGLEDEMGYTHCLDEIDFKPENCEPNTKLYDSQGCNLHCCILQIELLTITITSYYDISHLLQPTEPVTELTTSQNTTSSLSSVTTTTQEPSSSADTTSPTTTQSVDNTQAGTNNSTESETTVTENASSLPPAIQSSEQSPAVDSTQLSTTPAPATSTATSTTPTPAGTSGASAPAQPSSSNALSTGQTSSSSNALSPGQTSSSSPEQTSRSSSTWTAPATVQGSSSSGAPSSSPIIIS